MIEGMNYEFNLDYSFTAFILSEQWKPMYEMRV